MEIYLIRHTTPLIEKGFIYGRTDVCLTAAFSTEKAAVLKQLPTAVERVYSSPSDRCLQLAKAISNDCEIERDLYELNFGDWEGMTWNTIDRAASEVWMNDFVNLSPPNGESMLQMQLRVMKFWNRLLSQSHQSAAIVTHGGVIRIILAHYHSVALKDVFDIKVSFGEVFKLQISTP